MESAHVSDNTGQSPVAGHKPHSGCFQLSPTGQIPHRRYSRRAVKSSPGVSHITGRQKLAAPPAQNRAHFQQFCINRDPAALASVFPEQSPFAGEIRSPKLRYSGLRHKARRPCEHRVQQWGLRRGEPAWIHRGVDARPAGTPTLSADPPLAGIDALGASIASAQVCSSGMKL